MRERTVISGKRCLRTGCPHLAQYGRRGLCGSDYNAALQAIARGRSEEDLIREGKILPKREKAIDWFMKSSA